MASNMNRQVTRPMNQANRDSVESRAIQLLFKNPLQPTFTIQDSAAVFDFPENFFTDRYRPVGNEIVSKFQSDSTQTKIPLRQIQQPDMNYASEVERNGCFSLFNKRHRNVASQLITEFMGQPDIQSFISCCAYTRDRINPYLFQYALAVATAHRPDTKDMLIPNIFQLFPDQFIEPSIFRQCREEALIVSPENRRPIDIPPNFTASDLEPEQQLAFFREDIGVNMHHWHWHLVYPATGTAEMVNKDRRGELFYYMHSQIMARYNTERFAHALPRIRPFENFRDIIEEGYFPKIMRSTNNRTYSPRFENQRMRDINRDGVKVTVAEMERSRDRIYEAIDRGYIMNRTGQRVNLDDRTGIDILGDLVEASQRSPNEDFYGSVHNNAHIMLSYIHDPVNRFLEDFSVIGDVTTAMRDPLFYRLHAFVDNIFRRFKIKLTPYTDQQLNFNGITVQSITAQITRGMNTPQNILLTFWQRSLIDLSTGLDFGPEGNVLAQYTHLQHAPFTYRIVVSNLTGRPRSGTCRIFLGPTTDETGARLNFRAQRNFMIEMDKFTVNLNPGGNTILRRSDESSVTVPFEQTFRRVGASAQPTDPVALSRFQYCGCGWPQHMLLPKGTKNGMLFDLFVMVTDFNEDFTGQEVERSGCDDAASFCGLRDRLYPDRRPMGYPFDRSIFSNSLIEFSARHTNMAVQPVQIRFSNSIINRT